MKKLALLFVALMVTTIAVTAAPLQTKTPQTPQTSKEVAMSKPTAKKTPHKTTKEVKKMETVKPVAKK